MDNPTIGQKAWFGFPRSVGLIVSAISYVFLTNDPKLGFQSASDKIAVSIALGLGAWFIASIIMHMAPEFYWTYLWQMGCGLVVLSASAWPIKWLIIVIACIVATFLGSPWEYSLLLAAILIGADAILHFFTKV